jgi:cytochrome c5
MKPHPCLLKAARVAVVTALALAAGGGIVVIAATADDAKPETKSKTVKKLTGAELYAINCNRCHPERFPTEFNSAQWQTLMTHMRVRANLPAKQAREILKYLKEESGN